MSTEEVQSNPGLNLNYTQCKTAIYDTLIKDNSILEKIILNPFLTSFAICIVIILVVMFTFRNAETDEPKFKMALRILFYGFILTSFILMLNNERLMRDMTSTQGSAEMEEIFGEGEAVDTDEIVVVSGSPNEQIVGAGQSLVPITIK